MDSPEPEVSLTGSRDAFPGAREPGTRVSGSRVADVLASRLAAAGTRFAFGIPGGEVLTLIDALHGAGIDFRVARQESAAGFMAEGTCHVSSCPAVMVATLGPGVANAVNVTANALQDGVPLVVLGGKTACAEDAAFTHQVIDQRALFQTVTKATFELDAAGTIIETALATALSEPPGPVFIDCPLDVAATPLEASSIAPPGDRVAGPPAGGPDLADLGRRLASAQRPLLIVGRHALRPGVEEALRQLVERGQLPVLTTYKAKGIFSEARPASLGAAGLSPLADAELLPLVQRSDLILLLGYDPIEMRQPWSRPFSAESELVELTTTPAYTATPCTSLVVADLATALHELVRLLPDPVGNRWPAGEPDAVREALRRAFAPREAWEPTVLIRAAEAALDEDALVTVDTGAHRILLSQIWRSHGPGRLLQSTGFCTMACALPLAIGAKLASPERQVLAIVGDGGLEMGLGELATLRDTGLPIPVVVIDDSSYALIDMKQRRMDYARVGVDLGTTDFAALGRALGGFGERVDDREAFVSALERALTAPRFTVIHAPFPRGVYDGRI